MKRFSETFKFFKDPHTEKIQKLKLRYQELDDLSNVAVEIANAEAYKSLQEEIKEVFFDYLTAITVDSIYRLAPHVLLVWVISIKWKSITIPLVNWQVSVIGAYLFAYLILYIGQIIVKRINSRLSPKFNSSEVARLPRISKI